MDPYRKGVDFERTVRDFLKRKGYFCIRQAKSSFPDLIAIKKGKTLFVECKAKRKPDKSEIKQLQSFSFNLGVTSLWVVAKYGVYSTREDNLIFFNARTFERAVYKDVF